MSRIYWSDLSADDLSMIKLTYEDFFKMLDCYYGNIFVTDGNGIVLYFNEAGWAAWGLSRKRHIGKHVTDLCKEGIFKKSATLEVLRTKEEVVMETSGDNGKPLWIRAVPIFDDEDNIMLTVHYSQHQKEIKRFTDEIERNRQVIRQMSDILERYEMNIGKDTKLIYRSKKMNETVRLATRVAKTDGLVLIQGESGTGKELLARYVYNESLRNKEVFLPINCAAIPRELIESELFGYVPGAFTGASKNGKAGIFELANHGTIFLDEIGELPLQMQSKLLRVLETGELYRVGASSSIHVDVRIIAATNRNLQEMVQKKVFREDLFYRLNVIPLVLPPLRERPEDIPLLAEFYLKEYNAKYRTTKVFSDLCIQMLVSYQWPGNVRELKNMIYRMVLTAEGDVIEPASMEINCPVHTLAFRPSGEAVTDDLKTALQKYERGYIERTIRELDGNITKAAEKLGVHRSYIYRKLKDNT